MRTPEEIRKILLDNNITGYRLEKDLNVTQVGADKFLNGETKKPYIKTLKMYNSYIDNNFKPLKNNDANSEVLSNQIVNDSLLNYEIEEATLPDSDVMPNKNGNEFIDIGGGLFIMKVPLLEIGAQASLPDNYQDIEFFAAITDYHSIIVKSIHRGRYVAFRVINESMVDGTHESILPGQIVTCRELQRQYWRDKLWYTRRPYWVIGTKESKYPLLKKIIAHDVEKGVITCHSLNPDYDDFPLRLNDVTRLFYVIDINKTFDN